MNILPRTAFVYRYAVRGEDGSRRVETATFGFELMAFAVEKIQAGFDRVDDDGLEVVKVAVSRDMGVSLQGARGAFRSGPSEDPGAWSEYWETHPEEPDHAEGVEAVALMGRWQAWLNDKNARTAIERFESGDESIEALRERLPHLLEHPLVVDYLGRYVAASGQRPKGRPGRRSKLTREEIELYGLMCWTYANDPSLTLFDGWEQALAARPDLGGVGGDDPVDNLVRATPRKYDQSDYEQKDLRARRDKD